MLTEFTHTYSSIEVHNQLRERKKKDSESAHEYISHMRNIGATGSVEQKFVIQYIVDGIKGRPENKMTLYAAKNYLELKEQIEIYQRISKMKPMNEKYGKNKEVKKEHCYNCGSKEHKRRECTEKQKCFKCNKSGHIAKNCLETNLGAKSVHCTLEMEKLKLLRNCSKTLFGFGKNEIPVLGELCVAIKCGRKEKEVVIVVVDVENCNNLFGFDLFEEFGFEIQQICNITEN
ncbi:uncharacterized protein LOC119665993 [Teleopsis dalmanni]|uniref:uncharacterized protein LOC119665993 n=1 Tax=Teleopsis dalmanni TaxID=139649 RepID=UPI0018CE6CF4|nr:uncharacterized protein LOC119665993 [Teleopsis dalmanni]